MRIVNDHYRLRMCFYKTALIPYRIFFCKVQCHTGGYIFEQDIISRKGPLNFCQCASDKCIVIFIGSKPYLVFGLVGPGPGYQTTFAQRIRHEAEILTGAVGMITSPVQAEQIIGTGQADAILIAREFLRDPYWPLRAATELGQSISWPVQYLRAAPREAEARVPVNLEKLRSCFEEQHAIPESR